MLALEAAGAGADLGGRQGRGIVDINGGVRQHVHRRGQARPLVLLQLAGAHPVLVDAAQGGHHAHRQGVAGHLHAEDGDRPFHLQGHVFRQVHREAGLAHRGPPRHDDEVRGLEAGGHLVEIGEAGGQAGDGLVALKEDLDALHGPAEEAAQGLEAATAALFLLGDLEDPPFRLVQQLRHLPALGVEGDVADAGADGDELAQHRALAHDLGVGLDVGGAGGAGGDDAQVGQAAGVLELAGALQHLGQGDDVEGLFTGRQVADGAKDEAVFAPIEVALAHLVGYRIPGLVVQHEAAEQGLFRLVRMGGDA